MLRHYLTEVHELGAELPVSATLVGCTQGLSDLADRSGDDNPHREDEPRILVGDPGKFTQATGWTPRLDLVESVRRMIAETRRAPF